MRDVAGSALVIPRASKSSSDSESLIKRSNYRLLKLGREKWVRCETGFSIDESRLSNNLSEEIDNTIKVGITVGFEVCKRIDMIEEALKDNGACVNIC